MQRYRDAYQNYLIRLDIFPYFSEFLHETGRRCFPSLSVCGSSKIGTYLGICKISFYFKIFFYIYIYKGNNNI